MSGESTTPDPAALTRGALEAAQGGDVDALMRFYGPNSIWDLSPMGLGIYQGPVAIRGFYEDWFGSWEDFELELHEGVLDFGDGVTLAVLRQKARPVGVTGHVRLSYASVNEWAEGVVVRVTNYPDIDEARAAAERLAEERG